MPKLVNKTALITGASSGIGKACANLFAAEGARLILCARRIEKLTELSQQLQADYGTDIMVLQWDVRQQSVIQNSINHLTPQWQSIDILINNAGLALASDPLQSGSLENWETMIDTNIKGLLYVTRALLPGMIERQTGHIINIGSIAGQECYPNGNVYSASKHAVRAISKSLRMDLLGTPIRVTEIAPGAVETEFSIVRWQDEQKAAAFYQDFNPLQAKDIADAALYCVTRPAHVDIAEMTIMPTMQASANHISRLGRK